MTSKETPVQKGQRDPISVKDRDNIEIPGKRIAHRCQNIDPLDLQGHIRTFFKVKNSLGISTPITRGIARRYQVENLLGLQGHIQIFFKVRDSLRISGPILPGIAQRYRVGNHLDLQEHILNLVPGHQQKITLFTGILDPCQMIFLIHDYPLGQ